MTAPTDIPLPLLDDLMPRAALPGRITDPDVVAEIHACVAYGQIPWWRRWRVPTPPGWRQHATEMTG